MKRKKSEDFSQPFEMILVRRISQRDVEQKSTFNDASFMRKGIEACFAVIFSDAAWSYSAKRKTGGLVDESVIDTPTARRYFPQYPILKAFAPREEIQCQRLR